MAILLQSSKEKKPQGKKQVRHEKQSANLNKGIDMYTMWLHLISDWSLKIPAIAREPH